MSNSTRSYGLLACLLALVAVASGAEKDGIQLNVTKTTLDRADQRPGYYYNTRINRTEGLKVSVKNGSFKPLAEGEMRWEILVVKHYSGDAESMSGVEKLKALRPAESTEAVIGAAQVRGWRDGSSQSKDKVEWQVVLVVDGKEFMKANSTGSFDAIAKRATKMDPPEKSEKSRKSEK